MNTQSHIILNRTAHDDVPYDHLLRHKTYITVNGGTYESRLLNQYDLAECVEYADEPMLVTDRRTAYLRWLASHIRNADSIVYDELSLLADAADANLPITITVHADSTHGDIIIDAIRWMQAHTVPVHDGRRPAQPDTDFQSTGSQSTGSQPIMAMAYELIEEDPDLMPDRLVWVLGHTVAHMAYLVDLDGIVTAAVPGYGLVKLGRFPAYHPPAWPAHVRPCALTPTGEWEDAVLAILATLEADIEYPRYDQWDLQPDPTNRGPEAALPLLFAPHKPPRRWVPASSAVRPVYRSNPRWRNPRHRVLDADKQAQGKLYAYRPATPGEVQVHFPH